MTDVTGGTPTGAADSSPNRWLPLMGGVLMNLALGVIYAWSVFVAPFSEDFGWTRTQVSVVFTIAILSVGSWFGRRRLPAGPLRTAGRSRRSGASSTRSASSWRARPSH